MAIVHMYQSWCQEAKDRESSLVDQVALHVETLCFDMSTIALIVSIICKPKYDDH
jgi:hypothetical protein